MKIALGLCVTALAVTVEKRVFKRPRLPLLPEESLELRQDKKWVFNEQKIIDIERRIVKNPDVLKFENHEDYYLLHQRDFITVYDLVRNVPYKIIARITPHSDGPSYAFRFHEKRMDPRSQVWNDYRTPFFSPALGSAPELASEAFISSNMFDADHIGWETFCDHVLYYLTVDAGQVELVMTNNHDSVDIQLDSPVKGSFALNIKKAMLKDKTFKKEPRATMIKRLENNAAYTPLIVALKQADTRKGTVRYPTWKPIAFLCKNEGQYDPWWSHPDYHWNRCYHKWPPRGDEEVYECYCDDGCWDRGDCCTDKRTSCDSKYHKKWKDQACNPTIAEQCPTGPPVTLLISMDGFRYSYIEERSDMIPNIMKMRECGLKTHMQCSYPSKTFPNHYTLVTGLHPSQHGIVDNDWFDWKRNASCSVFNDNSAKDYPCAPMNQDEGWYGGDPIWNTVERHNKIAAACLWPGCELEINGQRATYFWDYDHKGEGPFAERVYQILEWLQRPEWDGVNETERATSRPDFMTLYFDEPDHSGHAFGPYDPRGGDIDRALKRVDTMVEMLMEGLQVYGMNSNCLNIVMTADHGMEQTLCKDYVESKPPAEDMLEQMYIKTKTTHQVIGAAKSTSPNAEVWGSAFNIPEAIDRFSCQYDDLHMRTFDKYLMPKRLHYAETTRIESIHNLMQISKKTTLTVRSDCKDEGYYATHGWDNKYKEMHVPLTLYGPAFDATKDASVIGSVQNIELYKLLLNLMGIEEDSANLNTTVMPQQFSAFGKFAPLMLDPLHTPQSEQTEQFKPELPLGANESDYTQTDTVIWSEKLKAPIYMTKKHIKDDMTELFNELEKPFWWDSMINMLSEMNVEFANDFDIQAGLAYDVTGLGTYVAPEDFVDGRQGFSGINGCCKDDGCLEQWCKVNDQAIPTHFYMIMRTGESDVFNVLVPWRSTQQADAQCRIANNDECRQTYAGDFNCHEADAYTEQGLSKAWWRDQMDEHSAKIIEIEKMTGLKFFQSNTIEPAVSVAMRTFMSEFGDFLKLLPLDEIETTTSTTAPTPPPPSPPTTGSNANVVLISLTVLVCTLLL